jgi:hypothetical protein
MCRSFFQTRSGTKDTMQSSFQWAGISTPHIHHSMRTGSMIRGHLIVVMMVVPLEMLDPIMTIFEEGPATGNTKCECDVLPCLLRRRVVISVA